jgi:hypothetical protein
MGLLIEPMPTCARLKCLASTVCRAVLTAAHAIRTDGDDAIHFAQIKLRFAEFTFRISLNRFDDVAAKMIIARALRFNFNARVRRPDNLIGRGFDVFALE